ncbi:hypothetical protein [Acinetobacter variabilis]|uniref:Uncharacterized protein n=1 Tax=Acinetobacter variabilis TaxID=70346 RepID=N9NXW8_9GAMM|nr:hypothetical protein [Acinetobacter variabilis]ENX06775.1 hypothetical protein F897_03060 [Acinetobacter variabilis]UBI31939.1 hypothetical protein LA331_07365 [Acinetobacter variabilis]
MLQDQLSKLPNAIWVQIYKDKMQLMDNEGMIVQTMVPSVPYAHELSIIADFKAASETLKQLVSTSIVQKLWGSTTLLQVMDMPEEGLTALEQRALLELGYENSAQKVILYDPEGQEITKASLSTTYPKTNLKIFLVILIVVIAASIWFLTL